MRRWWLMHGIVFLLLASLVWAMMAYARGTQSHPGALFVLSHMSKG